MMPLTAPQRLYLAAVGFLGLWVGVFCYFNPALAEWALPWLVPPLAASFLGATYLAGGIAMVVCIFSRRWAEIRTALPMIAIWTGGLAVVSLWYTSTFDFHKIQVWVWFGAYIVYPLIALGWLWRYRDQRQLHPPDEPTRPQWVRLYLIAQGSAITMLSLALLLAPALMQSLWPWKAGAMLLQLYSQPLLAYGIGSLLLARQPTWSEIRAVVIAMLVLAGAELIASIRFASLFDGPPGSVGLWFASLALMAAVLLILSVCAISATRHSPATVARTGTAPEHGGTT